MTRKGGKHSKKGFFSDVRLPVARQYVYPSARTKMLLIGIVGALVIAAVFVFNITAQQGTLISNGPLSSNHAPFGDDCSNCHTPFGDVSVDQCGVCHEKYGDDVGVHTFTSHYLYRSGDFSRVVPDPNEPACFACHTEHVGREAPITQVSDAQCLTCHEYGSFNRNHPEFEFHAEAQPDAANLKFPHAFHVSEVQDRQEVGDVEQTCLYCHNPDPDGKNFQAIDFDRHCDACHLTTSVSTPFLAVKDGDEPGVLTLETIQARQAPGTRWSYYVNANDFQQRGASVRKRPLDHQDPWVLENLRQLRSTLYPSSGLADLLNASADVEPRQARQLYEEAIATLRDHAEALRAQPERQVQDELEEVEELLLEVEQRLRDPFSPLDETRFAVSAAGQDTALTADQAQAYHAFIDDLTEPCQMCHFVENATLLRAQADQEVFTRAEFDHRAHIIQRRCLDCHTAIPIRELVALDAEPDSTRDYAAIQNIPDIATCQTCHTDTEAANTCTTCHLFHPDKSQHSNLLLYLK